MITHQRKLGMRLQYKSIVGNSPGARPSLDRQLRRQHLESKRLNILKYRWLIVFVDGICRWLYPVAFFNSFSMFKHLK